MTAKESESGLRAYLPLAGVVGVVLLYDASLLTMRGLALGDDDILQYYPAAATLAGALAQGTLPFWTPLVQAGFPLLADGQLGALYPFNLFAFGLLGTPAAYNLIVVLHHVLGTLFTFYWGRVLGLSAVACALMALLTALMTPLSGSALPIIEVLTWVPLLFAVVERCLQRGSGAAAWPAAPLVAMQWLAGAPQMAAYTLVAIAIYVAARVVRENRPWRRRAAVLAAVCAAALIGLGIAAPQILPTYELSGYTIRAGGVPAGLAGERSLVPLALITFLAPSWIPFFSASGLGVGAYVGVIPLTLALAAPAVRARPRWVMPMFAVVLLTALLACGRYSPLFPLVRRLPVLAYFRIPSRFLLLAQFPLLALFAAGWDGIVALPALQAVRTFRRLLLAGTVLLVGNGLLALPLLALHSQIIAWGERFAQNHILTNSFHVQPVAYYHAKIEALYAALLRAVSLPNRLVWVPLAIMLCAWGLWRRDRADTAWRPVLLAALILIDAWVYVGGAREVATLATVTQLVPTARVLSEAPDRERCRILPVIDADAAVNRTRQLALLPANYNLLAGVSSAGLYTPLGFYAYARLMEPVGGVDVGYGYRPVQPDDIRAGNALLNFLNVCYLLSRAPLPGFTEVGREEGVGIYRNEQASPRAFVVDQAETVASVDAALAWIREHPDRLRNTAVLEQPLAVRLDVGAAAAATSRTVDDRPQVVRVAVNASGAVLLVLTDTYYPGWQVRIDGTPALLYRAYAAFRAVAVPAGTHLVEFEYVPTMFWCGVKIAAVASLILAAWIFGSGRSLAGILERS